LFGDAFLDNLEKTVKADKLSRRLQVHRSPCHTRTHPGCRL